MIEFKKYISKIEQTEIIFKNKTVGWNSYIYDLDRNIISGGTSETKDNAQRIALAELIEREMFKKISADLDMSNSFLLNDYPTSCGFAAGFSEKETQTRAILEAIERWMWSKWIDENIFIPISNQNFLNSDSLSDFMLSHFTNVQFFLQKVDCSDLKISSISNTIYFGAILGFKNGGVFLGSRVSDSISDIYKHSSIEAFRSYCIYLSKKNGIRTKQNFYYSRLAYYGENNHHIPNLQGFKKIKFPTPKFKLLKNLELENKSYYISRALMADYIPWHLGNEKRFIY